MEFIDEWKSQFLVGKVFTPPLLLSDPSTRSILGPLCFIPKLQTLTLLFSSPSLFRPIYSSPQFSLSRFLSTSSFIASQFRPQHHNDTFVDSYNRLQLLHCPNTNNVITYFFVGYNYNQLGFLLFSFKDSGFDILTHKNDKMFMAKNQLKHRICKILVNPVLEIVGFKGNSLVTIVGEKPTLCYLAFKLFKSSSIVSACWSLHLVEQSVVLLQNDLGSCMKTKKSNAGKRLRVLWDDYFRSSETCKWLGCDFSWHPKILIIARSDAVFLVYLSLLVLCDVRKPLTPVLQWAHGLHKPSYIDLFRLSELRANSRDNMYEWAAEFGFGIVLGSFCNCEFSLFCYGPSLQSFYAWDLPSDLLLSDRDCCCGSCLTRKDFFKDAFPTWIDWKRKKKKKKDIVLGFGLLNKDLSRLFHGSGEFGGVTLSMGIHCYTLKITCCASWKMKFPKRYKYFRFVSLYGYLSGNLTEVLDSKMKNPYSGPREKDSLSIDFHEILCEKLRICGFSRFRTFPAISFVLSDRKYLWNFQLFQTYLHQLPPFYLRKSTSRSSKWSQKVQRHDSLLGPVVPLPVLITLHEFRNGCPSSEEEADKFSSEAEVSLCCNEVMQVSREMAVLDLGFEFQTNDQAVLLGDDRDNLWADSEKPKPFIRYHLPALESSIKDDTVLNYVYEDVTYASLISKVPEYDEPCRKDTVDSVALDLLDDLSPIALKFDDASTMSIMPPDSKVYNVMKKNYLRFLEGSSSYQDYCNQFKLKKQ
ncbi:hypothetical protein ACOSQ2_013471 [Xanthoceras sorbifolium]